VAPATVMLVSDDQLRIRVYCCVNVLLFLPIYVYFIVFSFIRKLSYNPFDSFVHLSLNKSFNSKMLKAKL